MIVCICEGVSDREILRVIKEGARSLVDIRKACGAGSQCGRCKEYLKCMLNDNKTVDEQNGCAIEGVLSST